MTADLEKSLKARLRVIVKETRNRKQVELILVTKWCRFSRNAQSTFLMLHELK
ncbi:hypothetical protein PARA125_000132 [Parachlamydia sp. AcF125]|nr:hypothetical protein [Parachlamydia sp. AcF125]